MVLDAGGVGKDEKELQTFGNGQKVEEAEGEQQELPQRQRKRKLWLGIW